MEKKLECPPPHPLGEQPGLILTLIGYHVTRFISSTLASRETKLLKLDVNCRTTVKPV